MSRGRNKLALFFASGLGLGYAPLVPGTFGALLGVAIYFFLGRLPLWAVIPIVIAVILASFWLADQTSQILLTRDPQIVVIDEVAGLLVTMVSFPNSWRYLLAGFLLFRLFDIFKPWPANFFDKSAKGGWGIVMDDVVAGIYANLCLQILRAALHWS